MRIAISGLSGCGNTSTSTALAEMLGFPLINFTFKNLAEEKGLSFDEMCKLAKEDDNVDRELDNRQVAMAMQHENAILASRLAIRMLKDADYKIYLEASDSVRAKRIQKREGGTLEEQSARTKRRDEEDHKRYLKIYSIDNSSYDFADLIINTDNLTADEVANKIYTYIKNNRR